MDKEKILNFLKRYWLITIAIILSILALSYGFTHIKKSEGHISETYVSLAAFIMLIATSIMQNKDLNMQRKEMRETREEFERQTKEQEKLNLLNKETINLNTFFELMKMKDDKLNIIKNEPKGDNLRSFLITTYNVIFNSYQLDIRVKNISYEKKENELYNLNERVILASKNFNDYRNVIELYDLIKTIYNLIAENEDDYLVFKSNYKRTESNVLNVFHSLLSNEERALVLTMDKKLTINDLYPNDKSMDMYTH